VVHDVVIQKLPVRMILDRAGLVGNDGPTHHGSFDLSYHGILPDIVVMAPSDEVELVNMIETAYTIDDLPSVVRYPRGQAYGVEVLNSLFGYNLNELPKRGVALPRGKGRIINRPPRPITRAGSATPVRVALLSVGTRLKDALEAANTIEETLPGVTVTVADARFVKPLDHDLITKLAQENDIMITIEENSVGGFGSFVQQYVLDQGLMDSGKLRLRSMVLPDTFIEAGSQSEQYDEAELSAPHIVSKVSSLVQKIQEENKSNKRGEDRTTSSSLSGRAAVGSGAFQVVP